MTRQQDNDELIDNVREELVGMANGGLSHPSTKPVLKAAAVGAVAGAILPIVSWPLGLAVGAGYMIYRRARS